jgi:tRNA dimethylallyltransferase
VAVSRPAILLHGPTASGKTALAIRLADRLGGEIINADAMQVYADLRILTARPSEDDLQAAPHTLFGHVDAAVVYSAGKWLKDAAEAVREVSARGKTPILVGGTGLYLQALTQGLAQFPDIPADVTQDARARVKASAADAHAYLRSIDPDAAERIKPGDKQRLARAIEVYLGTGRTMTSFHTSVTPTLAPGDWLGVALTPPRASTYEQINGRLGAMLKAGALDEAHALWKRQLSPDLPVMRAHGMPGFVEHFEGRASLEDAAERAQRDTRRYAKRQMTWIAHQFTTWPRVPSENNDRRTRAVSALYDALHRRRET